MNHKLILALKAIGICSIIAVIGWFVIPPIVNFCSEAYNFVHPEIESKKLIQAIEEKNEAKLQELCQATKRGASVLAPHSSECNPLKEAIRSSNPKMVEMIMQKLDETGELKYQRGRRELKLIDRPFDTYDDTPLIYAIRQADVQMVSLLIKKGADVTCCGDDSESPLYYAVNRGNIAIVQALFNAGAYMTSWKHNDSSGYRLVTHAIREKNWEMAAFLAEKDDLAQEAFFEAVSPIKHQLLLEQFAQHKKIIDLKVLFSALKVSNVALCSYFWNTIPKENKKALLEAQNDGNTLLMWTAKHWNEQTPEWLALLFQERPNLDAQAQDSEGSTVLMHAMRACNSQLILLLLQQGANPDASNNTGETPRMEFRKQIRKCEEKQGILMLAPQIMDLMKK